MYFYLYFIILLKEDILIETKFFAEGITDAIINFEQLRKSIQNNNSSFMQNFENSAEIQNTENTRILQDRMIREMHEQEFLEAQRQDALRKEEEERIRKEKIDKENQEKIKVEQEKHEKEEKLSRKRKTLEKEPEKTEEGICEIAFRFPAGKRIVRRFKKDEKIEILYNFIDCLQEEGIEEGKYLLSQTMPKKAYKNLENTLENEQLFPKALIQIEIID